MEHLCFMRKCSIGETCNLIFEVLEPYRITRFQRLDKFMDDNSEFWNLIELQDSKGETKTAGAA